MHKFLQMIAALFFVVLLMPYHASFSQERAVVDHIVGVVGNNAILKSELMDQKLQVETQGVDLGDDPYCTLLDDLMFQKLLYNQAMIDSIEVSDSEIEMEIERRLRFFYPADWLQGAP